ncbi:MAG: serine/threonine-protein kinase [Bryobacteraceae bacterium]
MTTPQRIGRYEIVRRIGHSMTDVYLAIDTVENRPAALKLIRPGGDAVARMMVEAERRGAAIQREMRALDPRVVEIYDYGEKDGYFFVAMQYVEGRNLAEVLEREHVMDPDRATVIALEICEQLAKFHTWQSAVVHGDIKPSNIHLGPNDTVRLLDFGIAKTLRASGEATALQFGSPGYCAPERLSRSQVDQQSDLWAVGATLYEMLAGAPPYRAEDTRKLENLIRSRRRPRALPPNCPRALRAIVTKALASGPEARYRSAHEFLADLQAALERRPTAAEKEQRAAHGATATMEAAREYLRKATRTIARVRQMVKLGSAAAWFALGMALWIGGTLGWQLWRSRQARLVLPKPAPPPAPHVELAGKANPRTAAPVPDPPGAAFAAEAEEILSGYRASDDPLLDDVDWYQAEILLQRAAKAGSGGGRVLGELALSKGYATLERVGGGDYSAAAAARLRNSARGDFNEAARRMPADPAPHLGLARLYVYFLPDVDRAMHEFAEAARLGAVLGKREIEQQGDAYRLLAVRRAAAQPQFARRDADAARGFYRRIPGFDRVDRHLSELAQLRFSPKLSRGAAERRGRWR